MTTDTLRTEACPLCNGEGIDSGGVEPWGSPTPPYPCHLCVERKRRERAEAEVERLTEKLTSLQTAYLASAERDNSLTKELFDSRAEIESLSKLTEECFESKAEVERLQSGMQGSCYCCEPVGILNQELEAEVAFWKSKAYEAEEQEGKREMEVEKLKELVKWYESRHSTIIST